jgi:replication factor A1
MLADTLFSFSLSAIFRNKEQADIDFPVPVVQCLQIKTLSSGAPAADRYRLVLSDTENYVQCMLATQANHIVHDGLLQRGGIIRLKSYQAQKLKGRR